MSHLLFFSLLFHANRTCGLFPHTNASNKINPQRMGSRQQIRAEDC